MALRLETLTIDAANPAEVGRFWADVFEVDPPSPDEDGDLVLEVSGGLTILFVTDTTEKAGKNRLHFDLRPDDQQAELNRVEALGATRADIGQTGDETWVVLADPEGNEFCILRSADESHT
jgi:predicted enzyme related to lactoylglutathione lyase